MDEQRVEAVVRESVIQLLREQDVDDPIDGQTPLFSSGLLDSMSLLRLVSTLERTLGIAISPAEITVDAFDTLDGISAAILKSTPG